MPPPSGPSFQLKPGTVDIVSTSPYLATDFVASSCDKLRPFQITVGMTDIHGSLTVVGLFMAPATHNCTVDQSSLDLLRRGVVVVAVAVGVVVWCGGGGVVMVRWCGGVMEWWFGVAWAGGRVSGGRCVFLLLFWCVCLVCPVEVKGREEEGGRGSWCVGMGRGEEGKRGEGGNEGTGKCVWVPVSLSSSLLFLDLFGCFHDQRRCQRIPIVEDESHLRLWRTNT